MSETRMLALAAVGMLVVSAVTAALLMLLHASPLATILAATLSGAAVYVAICSLSKPIEPD